MLHEQVPSATTNSLLFYLMGTAVLLFNWMLTQISNHPVTWPKPTAFRYVDMLLLEFKLSIKMREKGYLSDFECSTVVP